MYNVKQKTMKNYTVKIRKLNNGNGYHAYCEPLCINATFHHHSLDFFMKEHKDKGLNIEFD